MSGIGVAIGINFGSGGTDWAGYWAGLVSAVVLGSAPTKIVITFTDANTGLIASDFTIIGKTINLLERDVTNKILTLTLSTAVIPDESLTLTFNKTSETTTITNNVLLLDTYTGAAASYSVRLLRTAYAGNCLRVRRSSDNAEQDIGFVSNTLDTTSLLAFIGANTGYVVKWYDQSGNGNDISLAAGIQPVIVDAGTLVTQTCGTPAIETDASARYMWVDVNAITNAPALSVFTAYSSDLTAAANTNTAVVWSVGNWAVQTVLSRNSSSALLAGEYMAYRLDRSSSSPDAVGSTLYRRAADLFLLETDFILATGVKNYQLSWQQTLNVAAGCTINDNFSPATTNVDNTIYFGAIVLSGSLAGYTKLKYSEIIIYASDVSANQSAIENNICINNGVEYRAISPALSEIQGYVTDGTYHYTCHTYLTNHAIRKRNNDSTWSIAVENTDPLNGISEVNHLGGCDIYNGKIYIAAMDYAAPNADDQCILIYDATTLAFESQEDISATAGVTSGLCIIPADNIIYIVDYNTATGLNYIQKYNLTTFAYIGNITLASALYGMQGITYKNGYFYIPCFNAEGTAGLNKLYKVSKDGTTITTVATAYDDEFEDVCFNSDDLRLIVHHETIVGTASVYKVTNT